MYEYHFYAMKRYYKEDINLIYTDIGIILLLLLLWSINVHLLLLLF